MEKPAIKIVVCTKGKKCCRAGGDDLKDALEKAVGSQQASNVTIKSGGCFKLCKVAPAAIVLPGKTEYGELTPADAPQLVKAVSEGREVEPLLAETKKHQRKERKKEKKKKKKHKD